MLGMGADLDKQQIPPLRFAPVGMTSSLLYTMTSSVFYAMTSSQGRFIF
jgi:hypothetical protein